MRSRFYNFLGWFETVHLVRRPLTGLLYQPRMIDDVCGAVCGMRIDRGNRSIRRKPAPVPLSPPQVSHDITWDRTRATALQLFCCCAVKDFNKEIYIFNTKGCIH
jgi:hypothetical protein